MKEQNIQKSFIKNMLLSIPIRAHRLRHILNTAFDFFHALYLKYYVHGEHVGKLRIKNGNIILNRNKDSLSFLKNEEEAHSISHTPLLID
jgi:hypothetical protein